MSLTVYFSQANRLSNRFWHREEKYINIISRHLYRAVLLEGE